MGQPARTEKNSDYGGGQTHDLRNLITVVPEANPSLGRSGNLLSIATYPILLLRSVRPSVSQSMNQ